MNPLIVSLPFVREGPANPPLGTWSSGYLLGGVSSQASNGGISMNIIEKQRLVIGSPVSKTQTQPVGRILDVGLEASTGWSEDSNGDPTALLACSSNVFGDGIGRASRLPERLTQQQTPSIVTSLKFMTSHPPSVYRTLGKGRF